MAFLSTLRSIAKSRTVWGSVFGGFLVVGQAAPAIAHYLPAGSHLSVILGLLATGATIYGRIRAKQPLGPVIDTTIAQTVDAVHQLGISTVPPTTVAGKVDQIANVTAVVKASQ